MSVLRRPASVLALLGLVAAGLAAPAQADSVADPAEPDVIVESIELGDVSAAGLAEPDVDGPSVAGGVAERDQVAVEGQPDAVSADQVVVGLSDPLQLPAGQVSTLGVTWDPDGGGDTVQVDVRTREGGEWGPWASLDVEQADGEGGRPGTEPYVLTQAEEVQVRALTADGTEPAGLRLSVIGAGPAPEPVVQDGSAVVDVETASASGDADVRSAVMTTADRAPATIVSDSGAATVVPTLDRPLSPVSAARPTIHLRSEWGAQPFIGTPDPSDVQAAVVHHTVSSNDYTADQVPAMLRSIQAYHVQGRGWSDIGYNFLVDRFGRIWEGRQGGVDQEIRGVHASEANSVSTGISVIGNFDIAPVPSAVINSVSALIAWKLAIHKVVVGETFTLGTTTLPNVIGHRDVPSAQTACPGRYLYALLPTIRARAAALQTFNPVWYDRGIVDPGSVDVLETGAPTDVYSLDATPVTTGTQVGHGWQIMDLLTTGPAFGGGVTRDLVAREASTTRLLIYHGTSSGGFSGRTVLGPGWGAMSQVVSPGDFDGDGNADLLAIERSTGTLWLYPGRGNDSFSPRRAIGNGWQTVLAMNAAGDLDGDGHPDLVGVLSDGTVRVYPFSGTGRFLAAYSVGRVPKTVDAIVAPGDVTQDGRADLLARDGASGTMLTLPGTSGRSFAAAAAWDAPWSQDAGLMSAAGWRAGVASALLIAETDGTLTFRPAKRGVSFARTARSTVSTASAVETVVVGDVVGGPEADVVTKDAEGRLFLHETGADGAVGEPVQIGVGWSGFTQLIAVGDANYDGAPDLLAKYKDGRLFLYPFSPDTGRLMTPVQVGNGFAGYRLVGAPAWNRNTGATVLAINTSTGALRMFSTRSEKYLTGGATIGTGWQYFTDVVALNNPLGDGRPGLLARHPSGKTWIYLGNGVGGFASRVDVVPLAGATGGNLR